MNTKSFDIILSILGITMLAVAFYLVLHFKPANISEQSTGSFTFTISFAIIILYYGKKVIRFFIKWYRAVKFIRRWKL